MSIPTAESHHDKNTADSPLIISQRDVSHLIQSVPELLSPPPELSVGAPPVTRFPRYHTEEEQDEQQQQEEEEDSYYWDVLTMAPLNTASAVSI